MTAGRERFHALTVDLEEWHHLCGVPALDRVRDSLPSRVGEDTRRLLDLLDTHDSRATFFILGWVAERHPRLVQEIAAAGHEIASHGHAHRPAWELGPAGFTEDLDRSSRLIESIMGFRPPGHRSAAWSLGRADFDGLSCLARAGYRYDSSLVPTALLGRRNLTPHPSRMETAFGAIDEWPPLTRRLPFGRVPLGFALGLRLTPNRFILAELDRLAAQGRRAVLSIHPWELSPDPPRVRLPLGLHLAHYAGLEGLERKLAALLSIVRFERIDRLPAPSPDPRGPPAEDFG
jgi:polysaccharide deacetylase family protein (PEP-CTERM system associated)